MTPELSLDHFTSRQARRSCQPVYRNFCSVVAMLASPFRNAATARLVLHFPRNREMTQAICMCKIPRICIVPRICCASASKPYGEGNAPRRHFTTVSHVLFVCRFLQQRKLTRNFFLKLAGSLLPRTNRRAVSLPCRLPSRL